MTINVTKEHIEKGLRGSAARCPVALAVRETTKNITIIIGVEIICLVNHSIQHTEVIELPESVIRFIDKFDRGIEGLEPFSFELETGEMK